MRSVGEALHFLELDVGGQRFALPEESVLRVVRSVAIVPLPNAPAVISGVIRYEGEAIPVMDLRTRLFGGAREINLSDHFVIARRENEKSLALHTDRALELLSLPESVVTEATKGDRAVSGMITIDDGLILVLDVERFLTHSEGLRTDEALTSFMRETSA